MVREVEMKQTIDQNAIQPKANSFAESSKYVFKGTGQEEEEDVSFVIEAVEEVTNCKEEIAATSGSSTATQLLVPSLSGYL